MADYQISAEPRTVTGKKVRMLRAQDIIPGNIYGKQIEQNLSVQFDGIALRAMFRLASSSSIEYDVTVDGKTYSVKTVDLQRHPTRHELVHLDMQVIG